jgi:hypothetical protein
MGSADGIIVRRHTDAEEYELAELMAVGRLEHNLIIGTVRYARFLLEAGYMRIEVDGAHRYHSTGCLHGDPNDLTSVEHQYCQMNEGRMGPKNPGACKFCDTPCVCPCHKREIAPLT